jgi:hypothetical protein
MSGSLRVCRTTSPRPAPFSSDRIKTSKADFSLIDLRALDADGERSPSSCSSGIASEAQKWCQLTKYPFTHLINTLAGDLFTAVEPFLPGFGKSTGGQLGPTSLIHRGGTWR